jgi:hemolysin activation/secretion protein
MRAAVRFSGISRDESPPHRLPSAPRHAVLRASRCDKTKEMLFMPADLPSAVPAEAPPAIVAPAPASAEPIYADSHGYHYTVTGNTLLAPQKIKELLDAAAEPKPAIDALNQAYVDAGYLFVVIGGRVDNKLVSFQVVEGRIAEIDGPPELQPYFRGILDRPDLTRDRLLQESVLADFYEARQGKRIKASYSKAESFGGSKLTLEEEDIPGAKPWSAGLSLGNLSGRFSSRYTWGASGSVRPGGGLEFSANYVQGIPGLTSESTGSSYKSISVGGTVVTPWGIYGLSYADTLYQIGAAQAPLFPYGETESVGLSGTQLLYANPTSRATVTESLTRYSNTQGVFPGEDFPLIVDQNYTVAAAGGNVTRSFSIFDQNATFGFTLTAAKGLSAPKGSFLPPDPGVPDPRFWLLQENLTAAVSLPAGFSANVTLTAQQTDATLPQAQQWIVGGLGNLSAWLPAVLVGDSGALVRAAVSTPNWAWGSFVFSGNAFAEAATSRLEQRGATEPYTRSLGDVGIALTGSLATGTTLTFAYAWPVWYRNVDGVIRDSVDRNRANLYFTLNQAF